MLSLKDNFSRGCFNGYDRSMPTYVVVSLFMLLLVNFNPDWKNNDVLSLSTNVILLFALIFALLKKTSVAINDYIIWAFVFFAFTIFSCLWSVSDVDALAVVKLLLINFALFGMLSLLINSFYDVLLILKLIALTVTINAIYIILNIDMAILGVYQIGVLANENWNGNGIGLLMATSSTISYFFLRQNLIKIGKPYYIFSLAITTAVALFTGSRKTFFLLFFVFAVFEFLFNKKNRLVLICELILFILAVFWVVFNVPLIYNVLGERLEELFFGVFGLGSLDSSSDLRFMYIDLGIDWFIEKPILGYGINNYRMLLSNAVGINTYSHNNYIELLCGIGIIGTIIYYYAFYHNLTRFYKKIKDDSFIERGICEYFFVFTLFTLISQYGLITYYDVMFNLMLCLTYKVNGLYYRQNY